jgi:hypothetical protein
MSDQVSAPSEPSLQKAAAVLPVALHPSTALFPGVQWSMSLEPGKVQLPLPESPPSSLTT